MKSRHKYMKFLALAVAIILAFSPINTTLAEGAISDNIGTAVIEQTIGDWDDTSDVHSVIGLLRLIISKIDDIVTKVNDMSTKVDTMSTKVDTMGTKVDTMGSQVKTVNDKIDQQTIALTGTIENTLKKATAAYNLMVYIPKSSAAYSYAGQTVRLSSASGNQSATATLEDDGTNYSTRLYFDFSGSCNLSYNLLNSSGVQTGYTMGITISQSGQEENLLRDFGIPKNMSWNAIHTLLQAGLGSNYGLLTTGTELPGGWYVIGSSGNNVRIWRKTNVGSVNWSTANSTANAYYNTFNSSIAGCSMAYSSSLLSKEDVESGWFIGGGTNSNGYPNNRTTGSYYWLSTAYSGGYHYYVYHSGGVGNYDDSSSIGCLPAVWIN